MGQTGELVFFTKDGSLDPVTSLEKAVGLADARLIADVCRTLGPDRDWEYLQENVARTRSASPQPDVLDMTPTEVVGAGAPPTDAPTYFTTPDRSHSYYLYKSSLGRRIYEAVVRDIPESIRGIFAPSDPRIVIGWHDIFECAEHDDGYLFGRAFFSFHLSGHRTPKDWNEFRRRVFDVPEVAQLKHDLEAFAGPMQQCVFWWV